MQKSTLMVQGTTSDAGKSLMVAGLCRLLARQGVKVAPFKPQNMALNSAVTEEGGEIGRAQALQADAAYLRPSTDMNPILIKPESDRRAQIIVHGKALLAMDAQDYHEYKARAMDYVLESYARLRADYDVVIVEGAGSPAEINLRRNDIANMGFAEAVDCPVILVADIDRGGVFATIVGTLDLLSATERERMAGVVINRFRGDIRLLVSGLTWLEDRINKPVLGVLPYLSQLHLDAEDALNAEQVLDENTQPLNVSVVVFPRISNHTDFDPLRLHPEVNLTYVTLDDEFGPCDLLILPGTKNVREDLVHFQAAGFAEALQRHLRYGGKLLGICGGLQMLGKEIADPQGVEGDPGTSDGLGLLDFVTVLEAQKTLLQRSGVLLLDEQLDEQPDERHGAAVKGYEIHCGKSNGSALDRPLIRFDDGSADGVVSDDRQILGSYLHGILDSKEACSVLLNWAGLRGASGVDMETQRDQQLHRLADAIEEHIDVAALFPQRLPQRHAGTGRKMSWSA